MQPILIPKGVAMLVSKLPSPILQPDFRLLMNPEPNDMIYRSTWENVVSVYPGNKEEWFLF